MWRYLVFKVLQEQKFQQYYTVASRQSTETKYPSNEVRDFTYCLEDLKVAVFLFSYMEGIRAHIDLTVSGDIHIVTMFDFGGFRSFFFRLFREGQESNGLRSNLLIRSHLIPAEGAGK